MICPDCHAPLFGAGLKRCPSCGSALPEHFAKSPAPPLPLPHENPGGTLQADEFASEEDVRATGDSSQTLLSDDGTGEPRPASDSARTMQSDEALDMWFGGREPAQQSADPMTSDIVFESQAAAERPPAAPRPERPDLTFAEDATAPPAPAPTLARSRPPARPAPPAAKPAKPRPEPRPDQTMAEAESDSPPAAPRGAAPDRTLDSGEMPPATGDTSVDATFVSDEWPEHEAIEPSKKTRASDSPPSPIDSSAQTMTSDDFDQGSNESGYVIVTQGSHSQGPDESAQTFQSDGGDGGPNESAQTMMSDAGDEDAEVRASEMRTLQTNFEDLSGEQPAATLKSRELPSQSMESVRGTLDTVPRRSMRSGETQHISSPDYDLIKVLGEGGMGVVWTARQTSVDRNVAVKMIKGPAASNRTQRQKFLAEAIVTGDLEHPNIVPIYDVGSDAKGILFYSMKKVEGTPWLKVLKKKTLHENLEILLRTADAVAFAHARGIIHRDLKPENVMLGSFGEVLVMDWGLALPTEQFQKGRDIALPGMGGTPAYMAPEMATGPLDRITYSSDVYLLGAILFELITNKAPHPGKKVQECLLNAMRNVLTETDKSGELLDIAYKAMATNPPDRYATVQDFQTAIREYLSHSESIAMAVRAQEDLDAARKTKEYTGFNKAVFGFEEAIELWPANAQARTGVLAARLAYAETALERHDYDLGLSLATSAEPAHIAVRNKLKAGLEERNARQRRLQAAKRAMGLMAAVIFLIASVAFFWIRSERNVAIAQREEAKKQEGIAKEQTAIAQVERDNAKKQEKIAVEQTEIAKTERDNAQTQQKIAVEQSMIAKKERDNAQTQQKIAQEQRDEAKKQEKIAVEQTQIAKTERDNAQMQQKIAVEQSMIAKKERDNAQMQQKIAQEQRDEAKKQEMRAIEQKKLAEEQKLLAEAQRQEADKQRTIAVTAKEAEEYESYVARIGLAAAKIDENAFDVAETLLNQCKPELRNWEWGRLMHLCRQASRALTMDGPVDSVAVSPDGSLIATGSWDRQARIWDAATGKLKLSIPHPDLYVHGVAWSPDGKLLATAGSARDRYVNLWNAATGELVATLPGHTDAAVSVNFSDNGRWLLSTSYDETARLWDMADPAKPREAAVLREHTWWVWDAAFSPNFAPGEPNSTNGIVTVSQDGKAVVWKVSTKKNGESLDVTAESVGRFTSHEGPIYSVAFDPSGKSVATAGYDRRVLLWNPVDVPPFSLSDTEGRKTVKFRELDGHTAPVQSVAFSKDGALLVSGGRDNSVKVWSIEQGRSLKTLRGHNSAVRAAVFSPDGRTVASASQDQRVLLWGVEDYEEFRVLEGRTLAGHTDAILGASFSPDGKQVLTASRDRTARSWDARTGKELQTFREGHDYLASSALVFRDGRTLITAAADNTVRFWDIAAGTQFQRLPGTGWSAAVALSSDERWLVTGSDDEAARLWDLRTLSREAGEDAQHAGRIAEPARLNGHNGRITAVAFAPGSNLVATGDTNGRCLLHRIHDNGSSELVWNVRHHTRRVTSLKFLNEKELLSASSDHTVGRLNAANGQEVDGLLLKHAEAVTVVAISKDRTRIATVSELESAAGAFTEGSHVTIFDAVTAKPLEAFDIKQFTVTSIDFTPDGKSLLSACSDNTVRLITPGGEKPVAAPLIDFNARGGLVWSARLTDDARSIITVGGSDARLWDATTTRESMTFSPHGAVASARFSPDGAKVVTGSWDNSAKIWQAETGQALLKLEHGHDGYINATVYSPDGRLILTASDDGTAKLWDAATGKILRTLKGHTDRVRSATFSRDGSQILTTSNDKTARLWNTATGEQVGKPFEGHTWAVLSGQFSPDGSRILTGGEDNEARLWDVESRGTVSVLRGHTAAVTSVAFSRDGKRAFTASQDNTAKLWDATRAESKEILTLKGHSQEVTAVTFSPDGREVLTASRDGKAILWLTSDWTEKHGPVAKRD
ncbi:protein kinase domain-containing protein [Planctomyces sp. SH-PL14]|uniref:WD40 domain-containing protein n=1 Tax=Planctomyces sp. SH-PL14 TaxID=1632864 RepID=UPI00078DA818|nr:protein kinase [Planctomyces sp. SH-PL14]AMV21046.1 Serine/threonine-protein kinase PknD [Planctomyces sp. SH-PL14]